ncbi:hypothetical protein BDQ17DRAFT_1429167 [Cyathus striatus]|nr:hypothetical protein BDQ17DRAFT_1429167 [Cyathus striatus]
MQKGIDIPYAPYYNNAMYAPRSYSRSSDGSDSHSGSGGGGGASYRHTVNPHELVDSPYRSQGLSWTIHLNPWEGDVSSYSAGAPEMHGNAYAYPSFDPGYQRQGVDVYGHGYHQPETAPIPVRRTPIAPTDPNG